MKTAGATLHAARMKRIPVWAVDDEKIKQYINTKYPKAQTDLGQRASAARILRIVYLYYRVGSTAAAISEDLKISRNAVKCVIKRLERVMGSALRGKGRPKNATP